MTRTKFMRKRALEILQDNSVNIKKFEDNIELLKEDLLKQRIKTDNIKERVDIIARVEQLSDIENFLKKLHTWDLDEGLEEWNKQHRKEN